MAGDKNVEVMLRNVRISFVHCFTPQERKDDDGKVTGYNFSLNALLDKSENKDQIERVREAMKKAKAAKWPDASKRIPAERLCLRDGEPKDEDTQEPVALYDGYAGQMFVSANRGVTVKEWEEDGKNPLQLIDSRKGPDGKFPRLKEKDGKLYSGCYANVLIRVYAYDGKGKNPDRINASLEAVQFVRHGEAFGSAPINAEDKFEDLGGEDDLEMGGAVTKQQDDDDDLGI